MAKLTCVLAVLVVVVVCAEAVRIDTPEQLDEDRQIGEKKNDPRCRGRTVLFVNPENCRRYIKCYKGNSKDKKCPLDYKFDSRRHCIPPRDNPDCKSPSTQEGPEDAEMICPSSRGMFPLKSDCHKYIMCYNFMPTVMNCTNNQYYSNMNGACINYNRCPQTYSEESDEASVCKESDIKVEDKENCRRYIKCVNFKPMSRECPPGKAFNPEKKICTRDYLQKCKDNSLLHIEPSE